MNKYESFAIGFLLVGVLAWGLWNTDPRNERRVQRAMYHWRVQDLSEQERRYLDTLGVQKLYCKFFDVGYDPALGPQPYNRLLLYGSRGIVGWTAQPGHELVPTVFITNACLKACSDAEAEGLGRKIGRKIHGMLVDSLNAPWPAYVREVQIDCDWTTTTRDRYFALLRTLREEIKGRTLSITLRLYPFKYRQRCGVPPADRAMLMCYNMTPIQKADAKNAIYDQDEAEAYLKGQPAYPLPLDVALPIFRWGILLRDGKVVGLVNHAEAEQAARENHLRRDKDNRFTSLADTAYNGYFLRRGDELRFDYVSGSQLRDAARLAAGVAAPVRTTVSLFNLDTDLLDRYELSDLTKTYDAFE
jgi:hypothetical protein